MGNHVRRFNFIETTARPVFVFDKRIRGALCAIGGTGILVALMYVIDSTRLHVAEERRSASAEKLASSERRVRRVKLLDAEVTRLGYLVTRVDQVRISGLRRANQLATIGNKLPNDTWLTSIRYENGVYSLEGESLRIGAVGSAILSFSSVRSSLGTPHLISLRGPGGHERTARAVRYTLRLERPQR